MHEEWLAQTKEEIKSCVVDELAERNTIMEIEEYKKGNSDKITELEQKVKELEASLKILKQPLQILVDKLYIIHQPAEMKGQLETLLLKESELFEDESYKEESD